VAALRLSPLSFARFTGDPVNDVRKSSSVIAADFGRQRTRILPRDHWSGAKRLLAQRQRELLIPRAHLLGDVPIHPFCDPSIDRASNPSRAQKLARFSMVSRTTSMRHNAEGTRFGEDSPPRRAGAEIEACVPNHFPGSPGGRDASPVFGAGRWRAQ
jgi:hypothetical protein